MNPTPLKVDLAIPSYWARDGMFIELYFQGMLKRSLPGGTDIAINTVQNDSYSGVGVISCDEAIATACDVAAARINEAMRITDPKDPLSKMRRFASEDEAEKEQLEKLMTEFFEEQAKRHTNEID